MSTTISLTQTQIFTALVSVLNTFGLSSATAGQSVPVIRGQTNRVPEPNATDFVVLWPISRTRLAMNVDTWQTATPPVSIDAMQETEVTIQADIHGPASADNAARITTLFRDQFGVSAFQALGVALAPLYTSDPKQMPFDNGEQQIEERWTVDLTMQANITLTSQAQFADAVSVTTMAVDTAFPA